jgi:uncharacterized protein DUF3592
MFIPITSPIWVMRLILVLGTVLLGFGLWYGAQAALLTFDGARATGVVTAKRIDPHYSSGKDPRAFFVSFDFTPEGAAPVHSELFVDSEQYDRLTVGGPVEVEYVRPLPGRSNAIAGGSVGGVAGFLLVGGLAGGVGALFTTIGGRFLLRDRRQRALVRRLLVGGVRTIGHVIKQRGGRASGQVQRQRRLKYGYTDSFGNQWTGVSAWMPRSEAVDWRPETEGVVRYDPEQPRSRPGSGTRRSAP